MIHQTMSGMAAQKKIDAAAQQYAANIGNEIWTLQHAHEVLIDADKHGLDLFQVAGLAKAIACFQLTAE